MKLVAPSFLGHLSTPAPARGLSLAASAAHDETGGWFFGSLCVPEDAAGSAEAWLESIRVLAITEGDQVPVLGAPLRQRGLLAPPAWSKVALAEGPHLRLTFSVHSAGLFALPLPPERLYVHAVAGKLLSRAVVVERAAAVPFPKSEKPGDQVVAATELLLRGRVAESAQAFEAALKLPGVAEELDGAHRYNGACAAARASAALKAPPKKDAKAPDLARAAELQARALGWLADDLGARARAHTRRSFLWAARGQDEALLDELDAVYRGHVRQLLSDPDLAGLPLDSLLQSAPSAGTEST